MIPRFPGKTKKLLSGLSTVITTVCSCHVSPSCPQQGKVQMGTAANWLPTTGLSLSFQVPRCLTIRSSRVTKRTAGNGRRSSHSLLLPQLVSSLCRRGGMTLSMHLLSWSKPDQSKVFTFSAGPLSPWTAPTSKCSLSSICAVPTIQYASEKATSGRWPLAQSIATYAFALMASLATPLCSSAWLTMCWGRYWANMP